MLEEEKYAIKELNEIRELVEEDLKYENCNITTTLDEINLKSLIIVLNLIEKQQKEIEELKEYMKNAEHNYQVAIKETIHKSKIQNLINKIIKEENYCINNFDKLFGQETNTIDEKIKIHNYLTCQQELSAIRGMIEELLEE